MEFSHIFALNNVLLKYLKLILTCKPIKQYRALKTVVANTIQKVIKNKAIEKMINYQWKYLPYFLVNVKIMIYNRE